MRGDRIDANQPEIVKGLRALPGVTVKAMNKVKDGFPDIAVGYRGLNFHLEIKDENKPPSARRLTEDEEKHHRTWKGHCAVVKNLAEAKAAIGYREDAAPQAMGLGGMP